MKFATVAAAMLPLAAAYTKEQYRSGAVMQWMMEAKESAWAVARAAGEYKSERYNGFEKNKKGDRIRCTNGKAEAVAGDANQTYACNGIDMYDFKTHAELGSNGGEGSGSWGVTLQGRDFIAIGQTDGAAFAEVTKQGKLVYLGRLPAQSTPIIWREIKANGPYMIIGSEAVAHGVQIFDMRKLLKVDPKKPKTFSTLTDVTVFNDPIGLPTGRSHNVVVNEERNYAVAVGAAPRNTTCNSGLVFINMDNPTKPYMSGCAPQDGYVHDAQCIVYRGPHKKYYGKDICYGFNEDTLTIYNVENKKGLTAAEIISITPYKGASYSHQGWVLDPNWQTHLVLDDELDEGLVVPDEVNPESPALDGFPVTYIFDITNLEKPVNTGFYKSKVKSVDHNQFVHNGLSFQSNYQAGLRVLDVSSIPRDPSGKSVREIAFFDTYPQDDSLPGGGLPDWTYGTWSHYSFPSGWIVINTIDRGPFVVKLNNFRKRGFGSEYVKRGA
ncbi:hypothetical protein CB0940_04698 [Cercospora beticola]|uniref:Uncharacterized protein n=1 Tax=Cercospora beticola TaxID=122368 RepID=A0A2G5HJV9_CERBT|nr:hypothetical protein CB0940_04698 [Cercospora beticola]PIA92844.1 hypothetical protein CB0940_04698 [Cercospora beticola]